MPLKLFWFLLFLLPFQLLAQSTLTIKGRVVNENKEALSYVTVAAMSKTTGQLIGGTTTEEDGSFELSVEEAAVQLELSFIGFQNLVLGEVQSSDGRWDTGEIVMLSEALELEEVNIVAERSKTEFKLDKRVFNVGKDISSSGAGALEVLNNLPSVNVDIEGKISLRGNQGVQILIDGKPSVASSDPRNALGAITAEMIESVEIITNPSAKYEAGGTSGIINIVLRKEEKEGINGSISLNTGYPNNHSIGGSLNRRTSRFNLFTQFGGGYRTMPTISESYNLNRQTQQYIDSEGSGKRNENFYNLTLGADYFLNKNNTLTLSGNYAYEIEDNPSEVTFSIYDDTSEPRSRYIRKEETKATNPKWQYDLQYKRQFTNHKDHVLLISAQGQFFGKDQESSFLNTFITGNTGAINQRTETDFYQADYTYKLDYTNPISKTTQLEAGGMYVINDVGNDYAIFDEVNGVWQPNFNLTNDFRYNQKVLGVYTTASYEARKWGVKVGLRAEETKLNTLLATTQEANNQDYFNLFPSLHTSYKVSPALSFQAGYSKRIFRPRLWDLNPFFNIQNNYFIRTGNPNLLPEFGDSYEITGILVRDKWSVNISTYHLYTSDVMENVSYFDNGVTISTRENVGTNRKTGLEINGKYTPLSWLSINGDVNWGYFSRKGSFNGTVFDFQNSQWSAKTTVKFKLSGDLDLELTPNYQSGFQTVQGTTSGFLFADAGLRKKILKKRAVVSIGIRDIFASRIQENIIDQTTFFVRNFSQRGRFITVGFSYSIGKGEVMSYTGGRR